MIRIESNVAEVAEWVGGLKARVQEGMKEFLEPGRWAVEAREVAERVVRGLATAEEQRFVGGVVGSVATSRIMDGLRIGGEFAGSRLDVGRAQRGYLAIAGLPLLMGSMNGDLAKLDELLLAWVREEKVKTSVDAGKSDEEIAQKLKSILLDTERSFGRVEASAKLIPHLQDFFDAKYGSEGLKAETVAMWGKAVVAGWERMVEVRVAEWKI